MQLLKAMRVTLASNVRGANLINEELVGEAIMGWLEMVQVQDENNQPKLYPQIMLAVCWLGREITPALSVYKNEELFSLGLAEEFEVEQDLEDEDDYEDDESE